jgi:hypothetical protein
VTSAAFVVPRHGSTNECDASARDYRIAAGLGERTGVSQCSYFNRPLISSALQIAQQPLNPRRKVGGVQNGAIPSFLRGRQIEFSDKTPCVLG